MSGNVQECWLDIYKRERLFNNKEVDGIVEYPLGNQDTSSSIDRGVHGVSAGHTTYSGQLGIREGAFF